MPQVLKKVHLIGDPDVSHLVRTFQLFPHFKYFTLNRTVDPVRSSDVFAIVLRFLNFGSSLTVDDLRRYLIATNKFITPSNAKSLFSGRNSRLIFDFSCEGVSVGGSHVILDTMHKFVDELGLPFSRVVFISDHMKLERDVASWAKLRGRSERMLTFSAPTAFLRTALDNRNLLSRDQLQAIWGNHVIESEDRKFHFLSLNRVPRPSRIALMLFLIDRGIIDRSLLSFGGEDVRYKSLDELSIRIFPSGFKEAKALMAHIDKLWAMSPMVLDHQFGEVRGVITNAPGDSSMYRRTFFSIVTESDFSNGSTMRITEKVAKPIMNFHPFVVVGNPYTLKILRDCGIQTFNDIIDESYDEIEDPAKRMQAVFSVIEDLANRPISEMIEMRKVLLPRLARNFFVFLERLPDKMYRSYIPLVDMLTRSGAIQKSTTPATGGK